MHRNPEIRLNLGHGQVFDQVGLLSLDFDECEDPDFGRKISVGSLVASLESIDENKYEVVIKVLTQQYIVLFSYWRWATGLIDGATPEELAQCQGLIEESEEGLRAYRILGEELGVSWDQHMRNALAAFENVDDLTPGEEIIDQYADGNEKIGEEYQINK